MACTTACPTQDHESWGSCVRSKRLRIGWAASAKGLDLSAEKEKDRELDSFADAVRQGINPESTRTPDIRRAVEISNQTGVAYGATEGN